MNDYVNCGEGFWTEKDNPTKCIIGIPEEVEEELIEKWRLESAVQKMMPKRKGRKTRISLRLSPSEAKTIYGNFSFGKEYLRNLVEEYVPENTRKSVDEMDYTELKHYGHVIFGVVKRHRKNNFSDRGNQ